MHWIIGYDSFGHDKILDNDMHWIVGYDSFGHEDKKNLEYYLMYRFDSFGHKIFNIQPLAFHRVEISRNHHVEVAV